MRTDILILLYQFFEDVNKYGIDKLSTLSFNKYYNTRYKFWKFIKQYSLPYYQKMNQHILTQLQNRKFINKK